MANFYLTYPAAAESANVVKLIKSGQVFADSTDVYTMGWNAGLLQYVATLDDTTFTEDYYRIEDGPGNIVVEQLPLHRKLLVKASLPATVVHTDQANNLVGEQSIKPDNTVDSLLKVEISGTGINLRFSNAAESTYRGLSIMASSVGLQDGAAGPVQLTGIADGLSLDAAVNLDQLEAVKGAGWTAGMTLSNHESRLDELESSGTFDGAPVLNFTLTNGGGAYMLIWNMNTTANRDAVQRYEIYRGSGAVPGYAAGVLSALTLDAVRTAMTLVWTANGDYHNAVFPAFGDYYFIVIAFDHTLPTAVACGSAQLLGSVAGLFGGSVPIVANAGLVEAITALAYEVSGLQATSGAGSPELILFSSTTQGAVTDGGSAAALPEWLQTNPVGTEILVRVAGFKSAIHNTLRIRCRAKTTGSATSLVLGMSTEDDEYAITGSAYKDYSYDLDLAALTAGIYEATVAIKETAGDVTLTDIILSLVAS